MSITVHPSTHEILRQPGYLYWNPTNLAAEATWGSLLGFCETGTKIFPGYDTETVDGEEGYPVLKIYTGGRPRLVATLKSWNASVIALAFPGFTSSKKVQSPAAIYTGTDLTSATYANRLLFVPKDGGIDQNVFLAQLASPAVGEGGEYLLSANEDSSLTVCFDLFRKGSGSEAHRCYYIGAMSGAALI